MRQYSGIALGGPAAGQSLTHDTPVMRVSMPTPAKVRENPLAKPLATFRDCTYVFRTGVRTTHGIGADFWVPEQHAEDPNWWVRELLGGYRQGVAS